MPMPPQPPPMNPGHFKLHNSAIPDLTPGEYKLDTQQSFSAPGASAQTLTTHFKVTAPRFVMPRDQILSTFPPHQSEGPFMLRLPQIVLKRRTLPWERALTAPSNKPQPTRDVPWLALVVLAEDECEFKPATPVAQCVPPGLSLEGDQDSAVADAIVVTRTVIDQIFPAQDELTYLAHVRAVDFSDTELAMGDDDGWLAVLISNRLPQKKERYRACLISLEGQFHVLRATAGTPDTGQRGRAIKRVYKVAPYADVQSELLIGDSYKSVVDSWSRDPSRAWLESQARGYTAGSRYRIGGMHNTPMRQIDKASDLFTFTVLANWQFACDDGRDFEGCMSKLHVGMLDSVPVPEPLKAGARAEPPRMRPEPQVLPTGHIELSHRSRAGEEAKVWYRGPLVPHPTGRDAPDNNGVLALMHSSDQARRIGPDGRENLSLAAAFEIGRLLALAEPRVIAAFLNWRKEGYEVARRAELLGRDLFLARIQRIDLMAGYAPRAAIELLSGMGAPGRLGAPRPQIDRGCPIAGLDGTDLVQLVSDGFGLDPSFVQELIAPGAQRNPVAPTTNPQPLDIDTVLNRPEEFTELTSALRGMAAGLAQQALAGRTTNPGLPDALDNVLDRRMP